MCKQTPPQLVNPSSFNIFEMQDGSMITVDRPASSAATNNGQFVFDWSDFPLLGSQHEDDVIGYTAPVVTVVDDSNCSSSSDAEEQQQQRSPCSPPPSLTSSSSSSMSISSSSSSIDLAAKNKKHSKKVSWDSNFDVRTYSLVVGDHPCCRDALPIQLGWEYIDEEKSDYSIDDYEQEQRLRKLLSQGSKKQYQPRRLSYMERKFLLQNVSGWNEQELSSAISCTHGCALAKQKQVASSSSLQQLFATM